MQELEAARKEYFADADEEGENNEEEKETKNNNKDNEEDNVENFKVVSKKQPNKNQLKEQLDGYKIN